jgi:hypothetical protein
MQAVVITCGYSISQRHYTEVQKITSVQKTMLKNSFEIFGSLYKNEEVRSLSLLKICDCLTKKETD